jgi:hypothetical protein
MSDFLTRLAQRSLGAAPLIAPRLPGLFTPLEESPAGNFADTITATDAAANSTHAVRAAAPRMTARAEPASSEPRADVHPAQAPPVPPVPDAASAPAPAAPIDNTQARVDSPRVPLVKAAPANGQAATPLLVTPPAPHPVAPLPPSISPRKPETAAATEERWSPLLPQRNTETAASPPAWRDGAAAGDAGTTPAPTVHISIGRVEVRANIATPPAAPRPRAAREPALSLDDYLKRGGGAS